MEARIFRWWFVILAPYVPLALGIGGLVVLGNTDTTGPVRLLLALGLLIGAGLIHVGLYRDARRVGTTGTEWTPHYWRYAVGGAMVVLGTLLVVDVAVPGGIFGAIVLSVMLGAFITAPLYLGRRYLTGRE